MIVKMWSVERWKLSPFFFPLITDSLFPPGGLPAPPRLLGSQHAAGLDERITVVHISHCNGFCPHLEPCGHR